MTTDPDALTEAERDLLRTAVRSSGRLGSDVVISNVERILSARAAALRADIARDIEAHADLYAGPNRRGVFHDGYRAALEDTARIALGGTE